MAFEWVQHDQVRKTGEARCRAGQVKKCLGCIEAVLSNVLPEEFTTFSQDSPPRTCFSLMPTNGNQSTTVLSCKHGLFGMRNANVVERDGEVRWRVKFPVVHADENRG